MGKITKGDRIRLLEEKSSNKLYRTAEKSTLGQINCGGVGVVWKNLQVAARITKTFIFKQSEYSYKEIIHGVNGCIKPNSLVAVMGASGSGKSTLMSVIGGRYSAELKINGDIRIDGKIIEIQRLRQISGYVYQDDLFIPTLTVLEHLHFVAQMKLNRRIGSVRRKQIIEQLLTKVGLFYCRNSYIGSSSFGRGKVNLSGGEQKKLSVVTELITDPPLLFCDEPTTGLDSFSALKLISLMKDLTLEKKKTIVCSIHQPNEQIFNLFHQVILLYNGNIAFSGSSEDALQFFKKMGYEYSDKQNPAEYLINSLAPLHSHETKTYERIQGICKQYETSDYAKNMLQFIEEQTVNNDNKYYAEFNKDCRSWYQLLFIMLHRNFLSIVRDPSVQIVGIAYKMLLAFNIGICLVGTNTLTQEGIQSLKGTVFLMIAENFFSPTYAAMEQIPKRLPIFIREYSNNINSPSIFYFAHLLSITPGLVIDSSAFTTILYWLAGLRPEFSLFFWTVLINTLILNVSNAFGFVLSVATNNYSTAQLIVLPLDIICMILAGVFISLRTVPVFLAWIRYVSWMTLSCEALLILQLVNQDVIQCSAKPNQPCLHTGEQVLAQLDFSPNNFSRNIIIIVLIYVILQSLGYAIFSGKIFRTIKQNQ